MSKKQKMIISVTAIVLVLATVLTCVAFVIGNQNDIDREREEYEQEQNANNNHETTEPTDTSNPDLDIPPVIVPDDTGDESIKEKALANAIPEFIRFNIVESEVRNVC